MAAGKSRHYMLFDLKKIIVLKVIGIAREF